MSWWRRRTPDRTVCEPVPEPVPYFAHRVDDEDPADYCGTVAERLREIDLIGARRARHQAETAAVIAAAELEDAAALARLARLRREREIAEVLVGWPCEPVPEPCEPVRDADAAAAADAHRQRVAAFIAPLSRDKLREVCDGMGLRVRGDKQELTGRILEHADRLDLRD